MKKVCVITGGGSGMGLGTAKILGKENYIIIVGRTRKKLEDAIEELREDGIEATSFACDISNRESVEKLAKRAREIGVISSVIHAAGMSPHMGDAQTIMEANAIGTININEAFFNVMEEDSCIIDVASMSAYLTPKFIMPTKNYKYSRIDKEFFMKKMMARVNFFPKKARSGVAYGISKNFVVWYAKTDAAKFGEKGIRVLSVSPGSFETPMGELEKDEVESLIKYCAIKRLGKVEEIANLLAFCASDKAGYLTGVDILCDGGCVASGCNPLKKN
ncbi:SDR family oxidoreductase [Clostridium sp. SHJSY1]|uniref:SDR family oxidoreductase n=1 Tax=Clostridium sp. SHJSY1 TaxID=2942483 RepID=UPI002874FC3E|nr:SDR family oxidoreductase [Clostridium sp. SHJSY1]MDS0526983.1 SDR family oxidoreductase [Clostridium sp. SHJSY1]